MLGAGRGGAGKVLTTAGVTQGITQNVMRNIEADSTRTLVVDFDKAGKVIKAPPIPDEFED